MRAIKNLPSCSGDYGILVVQSSHAKAVDGMDLATAGAARTGGGLVTHLDSECCLYFSEVVLKMQIISF
jgi:hypothetical protein